MATHQPAFLAQPTLFGAPLNRLGKVEPSWDPKNWSKFSDVRLQPLDELMSLIEVKGGLSVIDLGCGSGDVTRKLADMLPNSKVVGIDTSDRMIGAARKRGHSRVSFEVGDMSEVTEKYDLIFSNSSLQYSGNQLEMAKTLFKYLNPGGQLVVQVPSMNNPFFQILETASRMSPFDHVLGGNVEFFPPLTPEGYSQALRTQGAVLVVAFEKAYPIKMHDADEVAEWLQSGAMVPYTQALAGHPSLSNARGDLADDFCQVVRSALRSALPGSPVQFHFNRVLFSAFCPP